MAVTQFLSGAPDSLTNQVRLDGGINIDTLTGNLTLTQRSAHVHVLDPGGASRNVTLPALGNPSKGLVFLFANTADAAENLVIKNAAASTIVTVAPGEHAIVASETGTAWSVVARGAGVSALGVVPLASDTKYIHASYVYGDAAAIDGAFFIAPRAMKVEGISLRPSVVGSDGGAVTAIVRKAPSGTAPASGTSLHASGSFDLKGTVNTDQAGVLSGTAATLLLAAGDALCLDVTGTTTAARGCVTVALVPV